MRTLLMGLLISMASAVYAAEPISGDLLTAAPATRSVAATADVTLHQYFYVDFPRQLQLLQNEIALAEAELALIARRVDSYRPFRSFGRYAATYMADQSWQVALLAAQHRLECLRYHEADLWRQRRQFAEALAVARLVSRPAPQ